MTASKAGAEHKIVVLEQKEQELQAIIQQFSIDLQKVKSGARTGTSSCVPQVPLPVLAQLYSWGAATRFPGY